MKVIFARSRFLLTLRDNNDGKLERISDGYILTRDSKISKVGKYSESIGEEIISEFGSDLKIVGNTITENVSDYGGGIFCFDSSPEIL